MGLAVEVGILAEFWKDDWKDLEGYKYYLNQFELLNEYLPKVDPPTQCEFHLYVTHKKVQTPIAITFLSCYTHL